MSFFNGDIKTNEFVLIPTINTTTLSTDSSTPSSVNAVPILIIDPSSHPDDYVNWYIDINSSGPPISNGYIMKILVPRGSHSSTDYLSVIFQGQTNRSTGTSGCLSDVSIREGKQSDFIYYNNKWYPNSM